MLEIKKIKKYADSIALYVIEKKNKNLPIPENDIDLYNDWIFNTGLTVNELEIALWAKQHLNTLKRMPCEMLEEAALLDNLNFRRN